MKLISFEAQGAESFGIVCDGVSSIWAAPGWGRKFPACAGRWPLSWPTNLCRAAMISGDDRSVPACGPRAGVSVHFS